ncbi:serine/threonine-protein kinase [Gordonia hydrophobica]|uniref:non-specific serine/threonine protein kinase n=1 Tax=Gordonia hydrophobica TaxID=40516 RepID=A0ABZ2TZS8_9ACTN|nr:serine/threonine-protein kinase [Gordonia hydrophobica]MBM7369392.1 serine/threonine protein kinase [Gordonia hydrophobica]
MLSAGQYFADYRIVRSLGVGGMGEVYLAAHPRLPREDALKVLPAELTADATYRARFTREADLASQLDHPSIVSVYDRGEYQGQLWITMKFIPGSDCDAMLKRDGVGDARTIAEIITAVADALDYAHSRGMVHRDVKPANILVDDGSSRRKIYLTDFGIARKLTNDTALTAANLTVGSIQYCSPEQLRGQELDGRSDQYALACTAFRLLTGRAPFPLQTPTAIINAHLNNHPPSATAVLPTLAPAVDTVLARAMDKDPARRYRSCGDFASDLAGAISRPGFTAQSGAAYAPTMINPGPITPEPSPSHPSTPHPSTPQPSTPQPTTSPFGSGTAAYTAQGPSAPQEPGQSAPTTPTTTPTTPTTPVGPGAVPYPQAPYQQTPQSQPQPAQSQPVPSQPVQPPQQQYPQQAAYQPYGAQPYGAVGSGGYGGPSGPGGGYSGPPPGGYGGQPYGSAGGAPKNNTGKILAIVAAVVVVIALIGVVGFFVFRGGDDPSTVATSSTTTSTTTSDTTTPDTSTTTSSPSTSVGSDPGIVNGVPTQCSIGATPRSTASTTFTNLNITIPQAQLPTPRWAADSATQIPFAVTASALATPRPASSSSWQAVIAIGTLPARFGDDTEAIARKLVECLPSSNAYSSTDPSPASIADARNNTLEDNRTRYTLVHASIRVSNQPGIQGDDIIAAVINSSPMTFVIGASPIGDAATKAEVEKAVLGVRVR